MHRDKSCRLGLQRHVQHTSTKALSQWAPPNSCNLKEGGRVYEETRNVADDGVVGQFYHGAQCHFAEETMTCEVFSV